MYTTLRSTVPTRLLLYFPSDLEFIQRHTYYIIYYKYMYTIKYLV